MEGEQWQHGLLSYDEENRRYAWSLYDTGPKPHPVPVSAMQQYVGDLGRDGWQVVALLQQKQGFRMFFKRRIA